MIRSTILLLIISLSLASAATFTISPKTGSFPVTQNKLYQLALTVSETPLSSYWNLEYNSTGPTGGGIGLNNWNTAKSNIQTVPSGGTFDANAPVTQGKVRGQTTYSQSALNFGTLMKNNLYVKTPSTLGTMVVHMKFSNDAGDSSAVKYTITIVSASPAPRHEISMLLIAAIAVLCSVFFLL